MSGSGAEKRAAEGPVAGISHPWRCALVCVALVVLACIILRDAAGLAGSEPPAGIGGRIAQGPFRLALAAAAAAACLYAILQVVALKLDLSAVGRERFSATGRSLRLVAGRGQLDEPRAHLRAIASWAGDSSLGPLRVALTAFPMLGFLGTVIGLSGAIEALPAAMGDDQSLEAVLGDLHVAFDTTLIGLVGAIVSLFGLRAGEEMIDTLARTAE